MEFSLFWLMTCEFEKTSSLKYWFLRMCHFPTLWSIVKKLVNQFSYPLYIIRFNKFPLHLYHDTRLYMYWFWRIFYFLKRQIYMDHPVFIHFSHDINWHTPTNLLGWLSTIMELRSPSFFLELWTAQYEMKYNLVMTECFIICL